MKVFTIIITLFIGYLTTVDHIWDILSPDFAIECCDDECSDHDEPCDEPCNPFESCDCSVGFTHSVINNSFQSKPIGENFSSANIESPQLQDHFDIFHPP